MDTDQKVQKLAEMVDNHLNELEVAVESIRDTFEDTASSIEASYMMEDVAVAVHMLTQVLSLHGYFEMVQKGKDPLGNASSD